jgi:hypothetical protein
MIEGAMLPTPLAQVERIITSEPWYVTAGVAIGAALLGSIIGAVSTYRLNVTLDKRSRLARAEIRRKAKVYTPIRAELLALRESMAQDKHIASFQGILREDRGYKTMMQPPELYLWRGYVEDGRATFSASAHIRNALNDVDKRADAFNVALQHAEEVFQEHGDVILARLDVKPPWVNWAQSEASLLVRHRFDQLFSGPGPDNRLNAPTLQGFTEAWVNDADIGAVSRDLADKKAALQESLDAAIAELEKAMSRIAKKHENEPED